MAEGDNQTAWTESLPTEMRGHEAFKDVPDVSTLATRYLEIRKPFAEQLPEDIRGDAVFKDIKDLSGLAKSYKGQASMLGVPKDQLLRLPTEGDEKSTREFYAKLGVPEKADGYTLKTPDGAKVDAEFLNGFKEQAHKLGITPKQAQALVDWNIAVGAKQGEGASAAQAAETAERVGKIKTEWGQAFDQKVAGAQAAVNYLDEKAGLKGELKAALERTGLGNEPAFAKLFDHLANNLREDGLLGKATGGETIESPVEARQQIDALYKDAAFMKVYNSPDKKDQAHIAAVQRMAALFQRAHPEGRAA